MPKYRIMVWKEYEVCETYYKTVEADNEQDAMVLAEEAIADGDYDSYDGDSECFEIKINANENSIEIIEDEEE